MEPALREEEDEQIYVLPEGAMTPTSDFAELIQEEARLGGFLKRELLWRGPWWLDVSIGMTLTILINFLTAPGDIGFRHLPLNPYFIPILVVALRHGPLAGVVAGVASAALYLVPNGLTTVEGAFLAVPGLFVLVGAIVGEVSRRDRARLSYYETCTEKLCQERVEFQQSVVQSEERVRALEQKIEDQDISVGHVLRLGRKMMALSAEEVDRAVLQIMADVLRVQRGAVYVLRKDKLVLRSSKVARGSSAVAHCLDASVGLAEAALSRRRAVSLLDGEVPEGGLVLCAPLGHGEQPWGLLAVHDLGLKDFTPECVARFASLADWATEAYEHADKYRAMDVARKQAKVVETMTAEDARVTLLTARIADYAGMSEAERAEARQSAARALHVCTGGAEVILGQREMLAAVLQHGAGLDPIGLLRCLQTHSNVKLEAGFATFDSPDALASCVERIRAVEAEVAP